MNTILYAGIMTAGVVGLAYLLVKAQIKNKKQIAEYKRRLDENRRMVEELSQRLRALAKIKEKGDEKKQAVDNADSAGVSDELNRMFKPAKD